MKKTISFLLLVVCIFTLVMNPYIVNAEENQQVYNEIKILNEMAQEWKTTCETVRSKCIEGITKNALEQAVDWTDFSKTTKFSYNLTIDEWYESLKDPKDKEEAQKHIEVLEAHVAGVGTDAAKKAAENGLKDLVKTSKVKSGVGTVVDFLCDNASYALSIGYCEQALPYFEGALSTSDLGAKRQNMEFGVKYGTVACGIGIKAADGLIKNTSFELNEEWAIDTAFDLIGVVQPEIDIAYGIIKVTLNISLNIAKVQPTITAMEKYNRTFYEIGSDPAPAPEPDPGPVQPQNPEEYTDPITGEVIIEKIIVPGFDRVGTIITKHEDGSVSVLDAEIGEAKDLSPAVFALVMMGYNDEGIAWYGL